MVITIIVQDLEVRANDLIASQGHKKAFRQLVGELDSTCDDPRVSGWSLVHDRTQIFEHFLKHWFKDIFAKHSDNDNFALIAHGGQGRDEMCPNSDSDIMLFIDTPLVNQSKLAEEFNQRSWPLQKEFGVSCIPSIKNLQDVKTLDNASLNTLLDSRLLSGNSKIFSTFRDAIRPTYDYTDLLLHNVNFWNDTKTTNFSNFGDISKFDLKHGRGGLRNFQAGVWSQAIEQYQPCTHVYRTIPSHVLESVGFMLKFRYKLNLLKKNISPDIMTSQDYSNLSVPTRAQFIISRREIAKYSDTIIQNKLRDGAALGRGIVYTTHGVSCPRKFSLSESSARNRTYFSMLASCQVRNLPLDEIAHNAYILEKEHWLKPDCEFVKLFSERGQLSKTLRILADSGALAHIWPEFAKLETRVDPSDTKLTTASEMALIREESLESLVAMHHGTEMPKDPMRYNSVIHTEYKALSPEYQSAIKLALFSQDMPRNSLSQINVSSQEQTIASFILDNYQSYLDLAVNGMNASEIIINASHKSRTVENLRALYVFAHASKLSADDKESRPQMWVSFDELHEKTINHMHGNSVPKYSISEYSERGQEIVEELKFDFLTGKYASLGPAWIQRLCKVQESQVPRVESFFFRGTHHLGIAANDFKGLLSIVAGTCLDNNVDILQAHAFSPSKYGLALDFFSLDPSGKDMSSLARSVKSAIDLREYPKIDSDDIIKDAGLVWDLRRAPDDRLFTLQYSAKKKPSAMLYALTRKLNDEVSANIHALTSYINPKTKDSLNYIHFASPLLESEGQMRDKLKSILSA